MDDLNPRESPVPSPPDSEPPVEEKAKVGKRKLNKFTPLQIEALENAFKIDVYLCDKNLRMLDDIGLTNLQVGDLYALVND